ncbi:hypothetical protein ACPOL_6721 [Acidisarcina polymorpha]|uniref:Uncharacterized protein n=1 Tax=Acidisarcina polymorpha TaxID=2211140 RepID=A0A2Z5G9K8_9BACT|nr:hypothetical protein ACPOL_6721 [Acidisarcina polymorpha]
MVAGGVESDGFSAHLNAEIHLSAGGGDDRAITDDVRAIRLRTGRVGREWYGLSEGRYAEPHRQCAGQYGQTVVAGPVSRFPS